MGAELVGAELVGSVLVGSAALLAVAYALGPGGEEVDCFLPLRRSPQAENTTLFRP